MSCDRSLAEISLTHVQRPTSASLTNREANQAVPYLTAFASDWHYGPKNSSDLVAGISGDILNMISVSSVAHYCFEMCTFLESAW